MAHINIRQTYDEHDCETCGSSYATGFEVLIDGEKFNDYTAIASCFGGFDYELENVLADILKHLGNDLEFSVQPYEDPFQDASDDYYFESSYDD